MSAPNSTAPPVPLVGRLRAHGAHRACVGIGISTAEQIAGVSEYADGAIVGTALVALSVTAASPPSPKSPETWQPAPRRRARKPRTRIALMSLAFPSTVTSVLASIPSPPVSYIDLGPVRIHFYALCIIAGIIAATLLTNYRLTKRGAEPWVVIDISILAVPLAIIGARIFHVLTHPNFYFGEGRNTWNPFEPGSVWAIWEGGIAIFGALIGGAIGAYLGCRWTGIRFWTFADALAPGLLLAQAMGPFRQLVQPRNCSAFHRPAVGTGDRVHELRVPGRSAGRHPLPPDLPLRDHLERSGCAGPPVARPQALLPVGSPVRDLPIWYSGGRIVWESIRIDPSEIILGCAATSGQRSSESSSDS